MFSRAYRRPPPRRRLRQASAACETPAGNLRLQGYLAQGKPPFTGVPCSSGCRSSHEPNEPKYGLWVVRWTGRTALSDLTHSTKAFRSSELATSGRCCAPPPSPATTRAPRQVLFEDQRRSDVFSMFPIFEIYGGGGGDKVQGGPGATRAMTACAWNSIRRSGCAPPGQFKLHVKLLAECGTHKTGRNTIWP